VTTLAFVAPTGVAGTRDPATKNVSVAWTASPSTGVTGYTVERSLAAACGYAPIAQGVAASPYVDPAAPAGVAYRVIATGAGGKSSPPSAASPVVP
jgi:hypothetical protein